VVFSLDFGQSVSKTEQTLGKFEHNTAALPAPRVFVDVVGTPT
jgi:hypothetical protein